MLAVLRTADSQEFADRSSFICIFPAIRDSQLLKGSERIQLLRRQAIPFDDRLGRFLER